MEPRYARVAKSQNAPNVQEAHTCGFTRRQEKKPQRQGNTSPINLRGHVSIHNTKARRLDERNYAGVAFAIIVAIVAIGNALPLINRN